MSKFYWLNPNTRHLEHMTEWPHVLPHSDPQPILEMSHKQIDEMIRGIQNDYQYYR